LAVTGEVKVKTRVISRHRLLLVLAIALAAVMLALLNDGWDASPAEAADWATGDVFVAVSSGSYQVYDNAGSFKETISDGLGGYTTGCAFDSAGDLYTTNFGHTRVIKYDDTHPHPVLQTIDTDAASHLGHSESIVFAANGDFYVGHPYGNRDIHRYNAAGILQQTYDVAGETRGSDWIDLAADQKTIFYTSRGGRILRCDVANDVQLPDFANIGGTSFGLRLLPPSDGSGGLLVAHGSAIRRLDGSGNVVQTYDAPGGNDWRSLALDPNGSSFWAGDAASANFYRFNIATGAIEVGPINTGTGYSTLHGLCVLGDVNDAPVADDKSAITDEDNPVTITLSATDIDGDCPLSFSIVSGPPDGSLGPITNVTCSASSEGSATADVTYTPNADFNGFDSFTYKANDENADSDTATASITVSPVNDDPVADDKSAITDEDNPITITLSATDIDGDCPLSFSIVSGPPDGSLGPITNVTCSASSEGSATADVTYTPNADFNGFDSFTYKANDESVDSDTATASIAVNPVNDAPVVSVALVSQTVQYSDGIAPVTISASDIDSSSLTISVGLPEGLTLSSGDCADIGGVWTCTWVLDGRVLVGAGTYDIAITVSDEELEGDAQTTLVVEPEDAAVAFDSGNPVVVAVSEPGGNSGQFSLTVQVTEALPDLPGGPTAYPGDIGLAQVSMSLVPVGPGPSADPTSCLQTVAGTGYDAIVTVTCDFSSVEVNTYALQVTVGGDYYHGCGEDVLVVNDPSLGFTTGGGWFYWPGTEERTNFGFTMKYNKKGSKLQGSLLLIRHLGDGTHYRVKSNALYGLALGEQLVDDETYGWASFSGKATYLEPGWPEPVGNHEFVVYVEDRNEPGTGIDRFWIQVKDRDRLLVDAMSMRAPAFENAEELAGGNIVVPHKTGGGKKPR
jgi:hypothetical protein